MKNNLSHSSAKIFVVRTQKNCLDEMILLSTQDMLKLMDIFMPQIFAHKDLFTCNFKTLLISYAFAAYGIYRVHTGRFD